jgi:Flp pilus assembly protein TadD
MRIVPAALLCLLLAACQGGVNPIDAQKVLSKLEGPKVLTVAETQVENARAAEARGDFAQAAQLYEQALENQPENKEWALAMADNYRRAQQPDRAIAVYDALLKQDAQHAAALEGKALALMAKGDMDTPGALLEAVMKQDATRWKTLNAMGVLFSARGMQPEAQAYYQEALKHNPASPSITNNLGLSQALEKKSDEAIATLRRAAALAPAGSLDRKRIELNLSMVYAIAGKLPKAEAIARRYFDGATLNNNLGLYAHLARDDQLAKSYLNMALTESKTFYERAWDNMEIIEGQ